jgi:gamma-glutamyl phosphate reductase
VKKNTKKPDCENSNLLAFRAARTSREETYELGGSRVRITSTASGIVVAIDEFRPALGEDPASWQYRRGSSVMCRSVSEAEAIGAALFRSEKARRTTDG